VVVVVAVVYDEGKEAEAAVGAERFVVVAVVVVVNDQN
jgi:hypothetical protein